MEEDARDSVNDSTSTIVSNVRIEAANSNQRNNQRNNLNAGHSGQLRGAPPSKRPRVGVADTNSTILNAFQLMNGNAHKLAMPQFQSQVEASRPEFSLISQALKSIPMPPLQK